MPVVVVTDSSARLPAAAVAEWGIQVVPLHVLLDGQDLRDGLDAMPADLYQRPQVSTAGASPAELAAAYRSALSGSGGDGVVAVHIAGALSSTLGAAEHAAQQFGGAVQVAVIARRDDGEFAAVIGHFQSFADPTRQRR